jgi:hypothetical protein
MAAALQRSENSCRIINIISFQPENVFLNVLYLTIFVKVKTIFNSTKRCSDYRDIQIRRGGYIIY